MEPGTCNTFSKKPDSHEEFWKPKSPISTEKDIKPWMFFANQACSTEALTILSPEQIEGKVKGILRLDNLHLPYIRS
ncbi:UNVERIFIED_CONTAM: hypothetical protein Sradi_6204800 [Sesamum radiatum]|uniref:Uncharacterized protein n=1 Tax=Sesamum radiatum TaxID=300843 RepID=A0AAW2KB05_SESRA